MYSTSQRSESALIERFLSSYQPSCAISALYGEGLNHLVELVIQEMESCFEEKEILLPPDKRSLLSYIYQMGEVVETGWQEGNLRLTVRMKKEHLERVLKSLKG